VFGAYQSNRAEEPGFPYPLLANEPNAAGPCSGCFGIGDDAAIFPLADVDASDDRADTSCVASTPRGWFRVPCSGAMPRATLCEREPVGKRAEDCIGGQCVSVPQTYGSKTYLVVLSPASKEAAETTCLGLEGGSLVVFGSAEEREQLAHEIVLREPFEPKEFWIGLARDGGTWSWDDGVSASAVAASGGVPAGRPLPWGNAEPKAASGTRAYMLISAGAYDTELAHTDDGGQAVRGFICQRARDTREDASAPRPP
jgi:hypothetical protein